MCQQPSIKEAISGASVRNHLFYKPFVLPLLIAASGQHNLETNSQVLLSSQSQKCRDELRAQNIAPATFQEALQTLQRHATPWRSIPNACVLPCMIPVHICELAQCVRSPQLGVEAIEASLTRSRVEYQAAVDKAPRRPKAAAAAAAVVVVVVVVVVVIVAVVVVVVGSRMQS